MIINILLLFLFIQLTQSEYWIYETKDPSSYYLLETENCYSYDNQGYYFTYSQETMITKVYDTPTCEKGGISTVGVNLATFGFIQIENKPLSIGSISYNASIHCSKSLNCIRQYHRNDCFIDEQRNGSYIWIVEDNYLKKLYFKDNDCLHQVYGEHYLCNSCLSDVDMIVYCNNTLRKNILFFFLIIFFFI